MSLQAICRSLPRTPITNYDTDKTDTTALGWVRPGDPRSELVLSLFKEGNGLPLMLNGLSASSSSSFALDQSPSPASIQAISPLSQLRLGRYTTPTYIIHGTADELIPFHASRDFIAALHAHGVEGEMLGVEGVRHIHDLKLKVGSGKWRTQVLPGYTWVLRRVGINV